MGLDWACGPWVPAFPLRSVVINKRSCRINGRAEMAPIRTSYAWLGARWTLAKDRDWRDRGEGPVSYLAVVILVSLIAVAIFALDIQTTIANAIKSAVDKVAGGKKS